MNWPLSRRAGSYRGMGVCSDNVLANTLTLFQPMAGADYVCPPIRFDPTMFRELPASLIFNGGYDYHIGLTKRIEIKLQVVLLKKGGIFFNLFVKRILYVYD